MKAYLIKAKPCLIFLLFIASVVNAQNDSTLKVRKKILTLGTVALWAGGSTGLYYLWYKDYPSSSFHTFNDNAEWLQMDKAGHFVTSNITGSIGYTALKWAGYGENKALWMGGVSGWFFLTTLEVMDGFNAQWGFSWGDVAANTAGSLAFILQQKYWKEQKIIFKDSYHATSLADLNPDLLGNQLYEQMIKNYNGQTYWMSINLRSIKPSADYIPAWLNLALGVSAYGMLGGRNNNIGIPYLPDSDRYRRVFLSPDISLSHLNIHNKTLKFICKALDIIKFPAPTIEYNKKKNFVFHWLYF